MTEIIRRREEMMWEAAKNRDSAAFLALVDENAAGVLYTFSLKQGF